QLVRHEVVNKGRHDAESCQATLKERNDVLMPYGVGQASPPAGGWGLLWRFARPGSSGVGYLAAAGGAAGPSRSTPVTGDAGGERAWKLGRRPSAATPGRWRR